MNVVVWVDGSLREPTEPAVSALNHGFTVGDGVFETLTVRDGIPFALTRHLARMQYSADRMGLRTTDAERVREGVSAVLAEGGPEITRLRVTVTSGTGPMGALRGFGDPTIVITGGPGKPPKVCHAVRSPWKRNERSPITGIKTTSYAENVVVAMYAESKGADEAIMANTQGHLCEGTATNVFVEIDGEIVTPPLASGCLPGITRGLALEWGSQAGVPVRVAAPGELEMALLDKVIDGDAHLAVTSAVRGVQMVSKMDGTPLREGPLLRRLIKQFETRASADPDPAPPRPNSR